MRRTSPPSRLRLPVRCRRPGACRLRAPLSRRPPDALDGPQLHSLRFLHRQRRHDRKGAVNSPNDMNRGPSFGVSKRQVCICGDRSAINTRALRMRRCCRGDIRKDARGAPETAESEWKGGRGLSSDSWRAFGQSCLLTVRESEQTRRGSV